MTPVIYWFRQDLRLHDNLALCEALRHASHLIAVFCHDPAQQQPTAWGFKRMGAHRQQVLADALHDLDQQLQTLGSRLIQYHGAAHSTLLQLAAQYQAPVYCELIAAPEEQAEVTGLRNAGVTVHTHWQSSLFLPQQLPYSMDQLPDVFSTFRRKLEYSAVRPHTPQPAPTQLPPLPTDLLTAAEPRHVSAAIPLDRRAALPYQSAAFQAGERPARAQIGRYFDSPLPQTYKQTRNGLIGTDYSTKFSMNLSLGCVSPRYIYAQLQQHEQQYGANDSTDWIIFELLWRDYFRFLHLKYGATLYRARGLGHQTPPSHHAAAFCQWQQAQTGQPFIDAALHELHATGYLSNRMRQNVASYLVHDLQCDFRAGAAWFEHQLIDYDAYSNQGNWLYLAGRGTDPRGSRRFNPIKQAQDYDPEHAYRRYWSQT
jgi:deoxyribodipyrimidine photo-lyase